MNLTPALNGYERLDDPGENCNGRHRWSINDKEAHILQELFRNRVVLEIGTGLGFSTNKIAEVASAVMTVDTDPWVEKAVAPELKENVSFYNNLEKVGKFADCAFIDADHSYEAVLQDIKKVRELIPQGALIVFHDANQEGVMRAIIDSGLDATLILTGGGLGLTWNEEGRTKVHVVAV